MPRSYPPLEKVFPIAEESCPESLPKEPQKRNSFADDVRADCGETFLNDGEFAREVEFDGKKILAVVEEVRADELKGYGSSQRGRPEGVFRRAVVLHVSENDVPRPPLRGDRVRIDGELWTVGKVTPEMGMLAIELEAIDS